MGKCIRGTIITGAQHRSIILNTVRPTTCCCGFQLFLTKLSKSSMLRVCRVGYMESLIICSLPRGCSTCVTSSKDAWMLSTLCSLQQLHTLPGVCVFSCRLSSSISLLSNTFTPALLHLNTPSHPVTSRHDSIPIIPPPLLLCVLSKVSHNCRTLFVPQSTFIGPIKTADLFKSTCRCLNAFTVLQCRIQLSPFPSTSRCGELPLLYHFCPAARSHFIKCAA